MIERPVKPEEIWWYSKSTEIICGNPGALKVLCELYGCSKIYEKIPKGHGFDFFLCMLITLDLKGPTLWILYKNKCKGNIENTVDFIFEMIEKYREDIKNISEGKNDKIEEC